MKVFCNKNDALSSGLKFLLAFLDTIGRLGEVPLLIVVNIIVNGCVLGIAR